MAGKQEKKRFRDSAGGHALTALFFLSGACAIATQLLCIRELLAVFFGNELCIGVIFGTWFAGICAGACCGARVRQGDAAPLWLAGAVTALGALSLCMVGAARLARFVISIPAGGSASLAATAAGSLLAAFPPGCAVGFVFPLACAAAGFGESAGRGIGRVYVWESLGSLAAGALIPLVAIPAYPPLSILGVAATALYAAAGMYAAFAGRGRLARLTAAACLTLAALVAAALCTGQLRRLDDALRALQWRSLGNGLRRIAEVDSRYQRITLAEADEQYSLFLNSALWRSYPDPYQDARMAHLVLTQHPAPDRVLMLGSATGGMPAEMLRHPVRSLTCVSLDPAVDRIIEPVLAAADRRALRDPRVRRYYQDPRRFVKTASGSYDVIIVAAPDPSTALLNRLYTVDFFTELSRLLNPGGMVAVGLSSESAYISQVAAAYNGALYQSLRRVFSHVLVVPGERNLFCAARSEHVFSDDPALLARRYADRRIATEYFSDALFPFAVQREKIHALRTVLEGSAAGSGINTDLHPVAYYYNLVLWDRSVGGTGLPELLLRMLREHTALLAAGVVLAVVCAAVPIARARPAAALHAAGLCVIGVTGFAAMALEIALVFLFQNRYGYVYEQIGVIAALFMLGLVLGSGTARIVLRGRAAGGRGLPAAILCVHMLLLGFTALVPLLARVPEGAASVWYLLLLLLGALAGCQFPLVCQTAAAAGQPGVAAAGWMNAADHGGACCGAVLTGTVLVPLLGITGTCRAVGALLLVGIGLVGLSMVGDSWFARRRK